MWAIRKPTTADVIEDILNGLRDQAPRHADLAQIGGLHSATLFDEKRPDSLIREDASMGMSRDSDLAILKALVEFVERKAIWNGRKTNRPVFQTARSDGFAAFCKSQVGARRAANRARENALCEAIERYAWSTWWDDTSTAFECSSQWLNRPLPAWVDELHQALCELVPIRCTSFIEPSLCHSKHRVFIVFAHLANGGLCSGGACAPQGSEESAIERAFGELARHVACAYNIQRGWKPRTFYERRLSYMLTAKAGEAFEARLQNRGRRKIDLPALQFNEVVPHEFDHLVSVHRCYFINQPPFIGGSLERLCL